MSKNALETLFESRARLKILKFLFRNFDHRYTFREIVKHTQEDPAQIRRELARLREINLIHEEEKKETKQEK